jgi:hypothetical protein
MRYRKVAYLTGVVAVLVVFFSRCFHGSTGGSNDFRGPQYAGSQACVSCHQAVVNSYSHNNHFKTSSPVEAGSLKRMTGGAEGSFFFLDSTRVRIEQRNHSLYQRLAPGGRAGKFDIAFGSDVHAQTYGYWKAGRLYQLPLTWFNPLSAWVNSPGFPASHARFDRAITSRCFECHASYVKRDFEQSAPLAVNEVLDSGSIIYGIDCERCHGPALEHVRFHQENPTVEAATFITRISTLTRQQKLDLCSTCHSGNDREARRSIFGFVPGDTLAHFYYPGFGEPVAEPDVHGQQLQMLRLSKCFKGSELTCFTCHSVHNDGGVVAVAVAQCVNCHQGSAHAVAIMKETEQRKRDFNLTSTTCIDCHMPLVTSKTIILNNGAGSKTIPYPLRTHKIAIYP